MKKTTTKKQVAQLFEDINKDIKKHPVRHWFSRKLFQLKNLPSDIRLGIATFVQRGRKGWSYPDTWDFDDYLTDIIIGGMSHLRKYVHGYPSVKGINSKRQWKSTLTKIINGFKAYKKACDYTKTKSKKKFDKEMKKFQEGMKLFVKYYGAFWD